MQWPYRIAEVTADPETYTLDIVWIDGTRTRKEMAPLIASHRAFKPLADRDLFAAVRVVDHGFVVEWTDEIDMSADGLWYDAHPEDSPFLTREAAQ